MRIVALIKKEMLHILRDIRILYFSFIWPILLLIIFGVTVSLDVRNIKMLYVDQDATSTSREFISRFRASDLFDLKEEHDFSWSKNITMLDQGAVRAVMIIPSGFERSLARNEAARVQILVDGSDNNTAGIMLGYVAGITADFNEAIVIEKLNRMGALEAVHQPIDARLSFLYNPSLKSQNFIVPGLIAVIMMIIGTLLTTLTITREWEKGTMEQLLYSPLHTVELIIGKITPYFIISMIQVTTVLLTSIVIFRVPFRGSILVFYGASAVFLLSALGVGIFISIISRTQQLAMLLSFLLTFLPAFLLSGFIFPIDSMPLILRGLSYLVPAKYFLNIIRGTFLKGSGFSAFLPDFAFMFVFSAAFFIISAYRFKKTLDK
jgi:ABC-2 type transport system permease protein